MEIQYLFFIQSLYEWLGKCLDNDRDTLPTTNASRAQSIGFILRKSGGSISPSGRKSSILIMNCVSYFISFETRRKEMLPLF